MDTRDLAAADGVRYRPSPGQQVPIFLLLILYAAGIESLFTVLRLWWLLPPLIVPVLVFFYLGHSVGVTLTPEAALVHTFRRRRIPWREIQAVTVERHGGIRAVVLCEASGRRTRLRAPSSGFLNWDRRFSAKSHTIGRWWLAHRGADWAPVPVGGRPGSRTPAAASGRDARIRPAATQTAPILLLLACLILETLAGVFIPVDGGGPARPSVQALVTGGLAIAAFITGMGYFALKTGVSFTADGLKTRGWRTRTLAWTEITSLSVERTWHGTRLVVRESSGRRTRLPGPRVGILLWDKEFAAKAQTVYGWWRASASADDVPLDLSGVRRAALWKRVLVGLASLALVYDVTIGSLVTLALVIAG